VDRTWSHLPRRRKIERVVLYSVGAYLFRFVSSPPPYSAPLISKLRSGRQFQQAPARDSRSQCLFTSGLVLHEYVFSRRFQRTRPGHAVTWIASLLSVSFPVCAECNEVLQGTILSVDASRTNARWKSWYRIQRRETGLTLVHCGSRSGSCCFGQVGPGCRGRTTETIARKWLVTSHANRNFKFSLNVVHLIQ